MKRFILFVFFVVCAVVLGNIIQNPAIGVIAAIPTSAISSIIYRVFLEDIISSFKAWLNIPIKTSQLSIFLYGRGGSGKTTFIKHIISLEDLRGRYRSSTENTKFYRGAFYYSPSASKKFKRKYMVPICVADYKGQSPNQVLNLDKSFKSQVNAILFMVDIVHPDPNSDGYAMHDKELVDWLSSNSEEKINDRIIQHLAYMGDAMLNVIFSDILRVNRSNLRSIRLVINKIDLIQGLIAKNHPSNNLALGGSAEDYVKKKFKPIERYIRDACTQNGISDVDVQVVSLTEGTGVRDLVQGLLKTHFESLRIR